MHNLPKETAAHLTEVAFLAIKSGMHDSAQNIFEGINVEESDSAAGSIGLATIALANGEMDKVTAYLDDVAFSDKRNAHEAKKLLLIAAMLGGDQKKAGQVHHSLATEREKPATTEQQEEAGEFFSAAS